MGKEDKEDTGFGFKDRAKAEETLKLLEQHDMNYRRLTVRGLLGRAKRVLTLTKAEEKIKNIKEAMEVFEQWLAELDLNKDNKQKDKKPSKKEKKMSTSDKSESSSEEELPPETVPGLGFKDAAAARGSLRALRGRDPEYQRLAGAALLASARRVLAGTRDETKVSNIKEAMSILEQFMEEYETQHLSRQNNPYLSVGVVRTAHALAGDALTEQQRSFLSAYTSVRGEYKRLRNVPCASGEVPDLTWDIVRNQALKELKDKYANAKLFNEKDEPTAEHLELIAWAYSPEAAKVKKVVKETKEDKSKDKEGEKKKDKDGEKEEKEEKKERSDRKRHRSSDSGDESPSKKNKE